MCIRDSYGTDVNDWSIQFVDTGTQASVGQRLQAVRDLLGDDDVFLANYSDNLCDLPLPLIIEQNRRTNAVATFVTAKPSQSFHVIDTDADQTTVKSIRPVRDCDVWVNGGFFVLRKQIFDFMRPDDDLVGEPFERLIRASRLNTIRYSGFWAAMDTFKEKLWLNEMYHHGNAPWEVWKPAARGVAKRQPGTGTKQEARIA
jgi:glucose-1-phosphate cytidylyltransferase